MPNILLAMKEDYVIHNLFWKSLGEFKRFDPNLSKLVGLPFLYHPPLLDNIPLETPGIYILTGGRQVGKTTALKLYILNLLQNKNYNPKQIYYLPCDTIKDFNQLLFEIDQFRQSIDLGQDFMLFIDEITYVDGWSRAIKSLADAGFFERGSVLITGSDSYLLKEALMSFPGRRGNADKQDFHLMPLSFFEFVKMKDPPLASSLSIARDDFQNELQISDVDINHMQKLEQHFDAYLLTGGYLLAINDLEKNQKISDAVYKTYQQWIIGDMLKRGKNEIYLRDIIRALIPRLSTQITWHSLASNLSIEHHQTVIDYINLLTRMDVAIVLPALKEDKLGPAPKKAKKISISDPFILHALCGMAQSREQIFDSTKELMNSQGNLKNALIEGTVTSLFNRSFETYYIKAEGEVDLAIILSKHFIPIEIKNSLTLNKKDLKQILKYKRGIIGYAGLKTGKFEHLDVAPISFVSFLV